MHPVPVVVNTLRTLTCLRHESSAVSQCRRPSPPCPECTCTFTVPNVQWGKSGLIGVSFPECLEKSTVPTFVQERKTHAPTGDGGTCRSLQSLLLFFATAEVRRRHRRRSVHNCLQWVSEKGLLSFSAVGPLWIATAAALRDGSPGRPRALATTREGLPDPRAGRTCSPVQLVDGRAHGAT